MFKKLREKITEEVQQTSLRLPVSVQQSVQQLTQTTATEQWLETVNEGSQLSLSPFSGAATSPGEQNREVDTGSLQDELLVDISDIRPAGHNKDLFSIDEDSHEGSPSKSGFQLVDLSDAESVTPVDTGGGPGRNQGVAGVTFDPTTTMTNSPAYRPRRDSSGSSVSDASGLFPIYEVPGVSFTMPQSDLESSSEWEDGSNTAVVDRLSKDTVYQAYLKMRQRYHKYKGRYADLARAYKDKEKESEKLRDVLTKTQDKALRKVSELKEQCTLEQQAKAHLEQELRSDLEEKDHKITALQTKVSGLREQCELQQQAKAHLEEELNADLEERELKISALLTKVKILQEGVSTDMNNTVVAHQNSEQSSVTHPEDRLSKDEGDNVSSSDNSSGMDNVSTTESASMADNISMADNVSVASHGSASTAVTVNTEAEELIEKLKGDVAKHKSLLARCMDNIRGNKERIVVLTQERDVATAHLQDKLKQLNMLKEEHIKELDSLRSSMESSALSMAETKKQLFEELQAKEAETERCKKVTAALEKQLEEEREQWQEELQAKQQELEEKESALEELETNNAAQDVEEDRETSVAAIKQEVEVKIKELEARTLELKESRTQLETQLIENGQAKTQLEEKVQQLIQEKDEFKGKVEMIDDDKARTEQQIITLNTTKVELERKIADLESNNEQLEKQVKELIENKQQLEEKVPDLESNNEQLERQVKELIENKQQLEEKVPDLESNKEQLERQVKELIENKQQLEEKVPDLESNNEQLERQVKELIVNKQQLEEKVREVETTRQHLEKTLEELKHVHSDSASQAIVTSQEVMALKEANGKLTSSLETSQRERGDLKTNLEKIEREKDNILKDFCEKDEMLKKLQTKFDDLDVRLKTTLDENCKLKEEIQRINEEKEVICRQLTDVRTEIRLEKEKLSEELEQRKLEKESDNQRLLSLQKDNDLLKSEKEKLNSELVKSKEDMTKGNEQAFAELAQLTAKIDKLNSDWAVQMNEKDKINEELSKKVLDLDESLKLKSDEYKQKIESLNLQLQQKNENEKEMMSKVDSLNKENSELKKTVSDMERNIEATERENLSKQSAVEKSSCELHDHIVELKTQISNHEIKLKAAVEEKINLSDLLEKVKNEKAKLQDDLESTKVDITKLNEEVVTVQNVALEKEEQNKHLLEEIAASEGENKKAKEEVLKVTKAFEAEMCKAKDSYGKLKGNFERFRKEKECVGTEHSEKITALEKKNSENEQRLSELQVVVQQREEKIDRLLSEKKSLLAELEKKVEELQNELKNKENLLKKTTKEFEHRIEEMDSKMCINEEALKKRLENSFVEKHDLEKQVKDLSFSVIEKDEVLVRQVEEAEQKIAEAQEDFTKQMKELEHTWEQRLRCEVDRLQKQHEENLASTTMELNNSQQSQLETARSSCQHAIATRDATIAALKDEADQQRLSHQEELDAWHHKYENLQSQLADAKCQSECQSERIRTVETNMEETSAQLTTSEAGRIALEERLQQATATRQTIKTEVDALKQNNQQMTDKLEEYEKAKEKTSKTIAMLEFNNEHNINKVRNMEISNKDLQDRIDKLCKEKEVLAKQLREGSSGDVYEQLTKEKEELSNKLTKEKEDLEQQLTKEKRDSLAKYVEENKSLQEQVEGLQDIRLGYEKQIGQIEENNAEMHSKLGGVQAERDAARNEAAQLLAEKLNLDKKHSDICKIKENLEKQVITLKGTISSVEENLDAEKNQVQTLGETIHTLQNNILNLQKQIEGLNETCSKLARDLQSESKLRIETQTQLTQVKQMHIKLEETYSADKVKLIKLEGEKSQLAARLAAFEVKGKSQTLPSELESSNQNENSDNYERISTLVKENEEVRMKLLELQSQIKDIESDNQLEKTRSTERIIKLEKEKEELSSTVNSSSDMRTIVELKQHIAQLESDKKTLSEKLNTVPVTIDSPSGSRTTETVEQTIDTAQTNKENRQTETEEEVVRLRTTLKGKDEELTKVQQSLKNVQEKLRVTEVVSGEVEELRARIRELQTKMTLTEDKHRQQIKTIELETERKLAIKEQECQQTISSAYDQQANETGALVRQHRDVLVGAQQEAQEKAAALNSVVQDYDNKLKYEEQLASLNAQHEAHIKEVEATWKARAEKMVRQKESHLKEEMDGLTQEWNKERRELERLTHVAATAFRSGSESVERLKMQVIAQRKELEEVKVNHRKEIGELKALLELKRRTRGGAGGGGTGIKLGVSLDEAAEFEYLKNILYQYMMGKETQTLSKVLCAVVKFDSHQQQEILEHEEQRQNLLRAVNGSINPELLEQGRSDPVKTL